jgi:3-dehydroquinate synthase
MDGFVRDEPGFGTARIEQRVSIELEYPVLFTEGMFDVANRALLGVLASRNAVERARVLVVVDDGVISPDLQQKVLRYFGDHQAQLELCGELLVVEGGERAKNDSKVVDAVLEQLFAQRMDRHSYLLAIGGGAVLDAVGYAASLFHRGMRLVRAPTTVLAQDDAGVGVKNGINAYGVKNALGTFAPPYAVINDFEFLATLPLRDHIAGIAEAIKVSLIRDEPFFTWIEQHACELHAREPSRTRELIRRCAALHLEHIARAGDPFETGSARPLDFGHWSAHKLEVLSEHELRHGEAVAIGMAVDTRYAAMSGALEPSVAARVERTIAAVGLPLWHPALELSDEHGQPRVLLGLEDFREHLGGRLTVTMLAAIGRGVEIHEIDRELMCRAISAGRR